MAYQYNAVSVGNTAVQILPSNNARKTALICNNSGTVIVYIGLDSSVSTITGMPLYPTGTFDSSNVYAGWRGAFWGITASGSADVRYSEWES